jgi:hypothetical protein
MRWPSILIFTNGKGGTLSVSKQTNKAASYGVVAGAQSEGRRGGRSDRVGTARLAEVRRAGSTVFGAREGRKVAFRGPPGHA